jgi:hypothetical protein
MQNGAPTDVPSLSYLEGDSLQSCLVVDLGVVGLDSSRQTRLQIHLSLPLAKQLAAELAMIFSRLKKF